MSPNSKITNPVPSREELDALIAQRRQRRQRRRRRMILSVIGLFVLVGIGWLGSKFYLRGPSASSHYEQALAYQTEGNLSAAAIEFKNALKKGREDPQTRLLLGHLYLELGDGAAAEKELEQARGLEDNTEEVQIALLRAKFLQGDLDAALAGIYTVSHSPQALLLKGDLLLAQQKFAEAGAAYKALLAIDPDNVDGLLGMARVSMAKGDRENAEKRLGAALRRDQTSFNVWVTKGDVASLSQDYEQARVAYQRALELRSSDVNVKTQLARTLLELGETEVAEQHLEALHNSYPKAPLVNYLRAVAAGQRSDLETAKSALLAVLSVAPGHLESFFLLATVYFQAGNFEESEAALQQVLDASPGHLPSRKILAAIQIERRQAEQAIESLLPVVSAAPDDVQALGLLGSAYMQIGEFDKANQVLTQAAKLAPDAASIRTQLAMSEFGSGKGDQALDELNAVAALNPDFAQADLMIVGVHLERQEFAQALEAAKRLAEKQPENPMPHNLMGGAHEGLGDPTAAAVAYEKALTVDPDFVAAVLNLARLDLIAGDKARAIERFNEALERNPHHHAVLNRLAVLAFDDGESTRGTELLEESRRHNPADPTSRLALASWYLQSGQYAAALAVAEEAFALSPKVPQTVIALARAELVNRKGESAVARLSAFSKDHPESIDLLSQLAGAQVSLRHLADATKNYQKILKRNPSHPNARLGLGQVALLEKRFKDALLLAEDLQASHPDNVLGFALEADALMASGKPQAAVKAYETALEHGPTGPLVIALARAHKTLGDSDKATQMLNAWLQDHPEDARVGALVAEWATGSGDPDAAIQSYEQIIETSPNDVGALNNLAFLYYQRGDQRGLELARRAYELAPSHPVVMDTYGWLLVEAGEVERGLPILRESVQVSPGNTEHQLHLGVALFKTGNNTEARKILQALSTGGGDFPEKSKARELLELIK